MMSRILAGGLLLLTMAGAALGQSDDLEVALQSLDADVAELRAFSERLQDAPEADREVLRFRQDKLSFAALMKLDQLVRAVAELPGEATARGPG